jgi:hypothetical protein
LKLDPVRKKAVVVKDAAGNQSVEYVDEFDVNIFRAQVQAAQLLLDRTGFSPVGTRDVGQLSAPPEMQVSYAAERDRILAIADPEERQREFVLLEDKIRRSSMAIESGVRDARTSRAKHAANGR